MENGWKKAHGSETIGSKALIGVLWSRFLTLLLLLLKLKFSLVKYDDDSTEISCKCTPKKIGDQQKRDFVEFQQPQSNNHVSCEAYDQDQYQFCRYQQMQVEENRHITPVNKHL